MTEYRHEWKHVITAAHRLVLRQRLRAVAKADIHATDGRYHIRSLYFDDLSDTALREKLDGHPRRGAGHSCGRSGLDGAGQPPAGAGAVCQYAHPGAAAHLNYTEPTLLDKVEGAGH